MRTNLQQLWRFNLQILIWTINAENTKQNEWQKKKTTFVPTYGFKNNNKGIFVRVAIHCEVGCMLLNLLRLNHHIKKIPFQITFQLLHRNWISLHPVVFLSSLMKKKNQWINIECCSGNFLYFNLKKNLFIHMQELKMAKIFVSYTN